MKTDIDELLELAKDEPWAVARFIKDILRDDETQAQAIIKSGALNVMAEEFTIYSAGYMLAVIKNILQADSKQAQAIVERGVLNIIAEKSTIYMQAIIKNILDADEKQAQAIVESGVLNVIPKKKSFHHRPDTFSVVEAIKYILQADNKQAQAIVDSDVIRKISEYHIFDARALIEKILDADGAQAVSLAQKDYIIDLMKGPECSVNKLADNIYNFAKGAAGFEKVEGGYVSNKFNIAVSDAAPTREPRALMVKHGDNEPIILAGHFDGTLDAFKEDILETHPNKKSTDRIHYDQVHSMMDKVASRWKNDARPSGTAPC